MFVAQLVGQLIGALLAPVAFMLFWGTGQVNVPNGPYPGKPGPQFCLYMIVAAFCADFTLEQNHTDVEGLLIHS
jgi:hypothetical protein